ncbi:SPFH domain-containing protein [Pseudomarimonas arenosa]|uniref:Band 7 domain-containing protein n=1 Tax=Pseudomarimonas arenosa TaxID=2774145 RepID=A0AAW3ZSK1_9GAMM|nr:SPFH domain-containing protein [Pseudomarimonas arenosa]MBD8528009.1 hypothetical protein [Pseudomarimonas arenosa]
MDVGTAIAVLLAALAAVVVAGLRRVPEGRAYTLHRGGRFVRSLAPGLHFTIPVLDQIAHEVDLVGHQVAVPTTASARAEVYFQILEPQRTGAALDDVDALVEKLTSDRLRALAPTGAENEPGKLAQQLMQDLNARLAELGLRVIRCRLAG